MRGYDHLFLEQDKNRKTPLDLAHKAGYDDLESDIKQKATAKVSEHFMQVHSQTFTEGGLVHPRICHGRLNCT